MGDQQNTERAADDRGAAITRRRYLAAGGVLAVGGLSGCLGQVARATTNTGASPAALYSGTGAGGGGGRIALEAVPAAVRYLPATLRAGSGPLSGEADLDGWTTGAAARAQDYNSSRSNKPSTVWWDGDDEDSDDDAADAVESLYDYLGGEPTVGERFVVSLPDARLPGGGGALADELTPRRLLDYAVGEKGTERCTTAGRDRGVVVHRDLACRNLLSARLEDGTGTRAVAAYTTKGGVAVTGTAPDAEGAERTLLVAPDGTVSVPATLDSWGPEREVGEAAATGTLVRPVLATPADCPCPMPALFYLRRCRHDDQYLYAGGWLIDDGALYENALTLLVGEGPTEVVGVSPADLDEGGLGDVVAGRLSRERSRYGSRVFAGEYDPDAEYLPAAFRSGGKKGYDIWLNKQRTTTGDGDGDPTPTGAVLALDAPVVHLVETGRVPNDVKFKAGTELSKTVN